MPSRESSRTRGNTAVLVGTGWARITVGRPDGQRRRGSGGDGRGTGAPCAVRSLKCCIERFRYPRHAVVAAIADLRLLWQGEGEREKDCGKRLPPPPLCLRLFTATTLVLPPPQQ